MTQLEFNFNDNTPTFEEWLKETNAECRKYGDREYNKAEGLRVYNDLVESDFFNMQNNIWGNKNV